MAWILVAESEGRFAERIRDGLAADGWQIDVVPNVEAATAAAAARAPELLIASAELAGAETLIARFARHTGGVGAIALLPEMGGGERAAAAADDRLAKPFTDQELRLMVRRLATTGRAPRVAPAAAADEPRLTSKDLFGDVLAEMEQEMAAPPPPPVSAPPPAAPRSAPPTAGAAPTADVARALERTLSGLLKDEKAKPPTPKKSGGVEDLLSRTLSGLDVTRRPAPAKPPAPPQPPRESAAPSSVAPPAPAPRIESPTPVEPPPALEPPPHLPVLTPPPVAARSHEPGSLEQLLQDMRPSTPAIEPRRPSRELDLSELDDLARSRPREKEAARDRASEAFSTQRVALPSALRGKPAATEFGQYTLLERIAVGGMAEVWKARMKGVEGFQKTVAIKKILPHLTDSSDFVTMFIDEAKLAAQLNHNNIIHIYDLGKLGDDYYIAMEFVDGKDLRSILNTAREKSQPLPLGLALLIASRLSSALDYAHRMKDFEGRALGLVHRDVSPQNVLISFEGDIKLCDFGIVKAVSKASKTQMGALKGKLQYMSPEQAWGRPVDARSDIFSLGSLLFEMLTGRRLFAGDSEMSVLDAVREGRIQAPRDLDPRLPLEVNNLVLHALAKGPDERFASAGEMQREIDAIVLALKPAPSTGELATWVKNLFGIEVRGEAAPAPPRSAPTAPAATSPSARPTTAPPAPSAASVAAAAAGHDSALDAAPGRGRGMLWLGIAAVLALGVGAYFWFGRKAPAPPAPGENPGQSEPAPSEPGPEVAPSQDPAATPAESGVAQVVDEQLRKREEELKRQYELELARKQQEVASAAAVAAPATAAPPTAVAAPTPQPVVAPTPVPIEPDPTPSAPPIEAAPVRVEPAPQPPAVEAVPTAQPARPAVKEGDLVQPGPGVRAPVLVTFNKPEYPPIARRMKVEGTVVVSLLVDESGRVLDVRLDRGVQQNVGINEAATKASRTARFQPATKDGVRVKMWYQLTIPFKL